MTSTYAQCILVRVDYASADELCPENHCTEHRAYDNIRVIKYKLHTLVDTAEILLLMNGKFTIAIVSINLFECLYVKEDSDNARKKTAHMEKKRHSLYRNNIHLMIFFKKSLKIPKG